MKFIVVLVSAGDLNRWLLVGCWWRVQVDFHLHTTCTSLYYADKNFVWSEKGVIDNLAFMYSAV